MTALPRQREAVEARSAFFSHGFRPFFLIAGLWAPIGVAAWMLALSGVDVPDGPLPMPRWHAHELLAGFVGAAMIGFLLTAIPNWTGGGAYAGRPLVGLAALFVAGRLALLPGSPVPIGWAAPLALAALPAAMLLVLPALLRARSARLLGPPALVLAFWAGSLLMLGDAAAWWAAETWSMGQALMANVALLLVVLIGGRIIPAFTTNALRKAGLPAEVRPIPGVDRATILALAAVCLVDLAWPGGAAAGMAAAAGAVLIALRLSRWLGSRTLGMPLLWVLHLAYALAALALGLKATWMLTEVPWAARWLHLQVAGALALMIVAVMTRATLGHTGRDLSATPATTAAYVLLVVAALLRVFVAGSAGDPFWPLAAAATSWSLGFLLFLWVHAPMLLMPRVDGTKG